jgi:hypothetical protein
LTRGADAGSMEQKVTASLRMLLRPLLKRYPAVGGWIAFLITDMLSRAYGYSALYALARDWPVNTHVAASRDVVALCHIINRVAVFYVRPIRCLQRSIVCVLLLRTFGVTATAVIGCRPFPFAAHAWVDVAGQIVVGLQPHHEVYEEMERL